jgi:hypothetical protein
MLFAHRARNRGRLPSITRRSEKELLRAKGMICTEEMLIPIRSMLVVQEIKQHSRDGSLLLDSAIDRLS